MTAGRVWADAVARHGPRVFLRDDDRDWTYAEFDALARAVAGTLLARGAGPGVPVAVVLGSTPAHLAVLVALSRLGAVAVPLDPTRPERELRDLVRRAGATLVVDEPVEGGPPVPAEPADVGEDDPWAVLYTSGSTSRPRGVVVPQRAFDVTGRALVDAHAYTADDTVLCVLPLHHASATLMSWAPSVAAGAALTLVDRFSVSRFWDLVRARHATVTIVVPTIAELLLTPPPAPGDRDHPLRLLVTHYDVPAFRDRFGVEVRTLWGMTETSGLGLTTRPGESTSDGAVGRPYPPDARVRVVGQDGDDVPPGEVGELWFAHPAAMTGYHGEPPPVDGWIVSGDLVREIPGGYAYVGRAKAVIKRGGENISAHELERAVAGCPAVREVVVVPVPDPVFVEEACAVVVWAGAADPAGLRAYLADRLAVWQVPRYVATWPGPLPKLANHKVDRRRVAAGVDPAAADDRGPRTHAEEDVDV
ncbi:class I adenylate-forming enzyme family protein [Actinophytocola gossypii]|uniref:AMP-binding protein n=1 Tax=Actinophytocola gossypii TaxID=2812003 RepID=A0ABT2J6Q4_9PSEU|nr:AMP-binding protein [Actinophytocola gossypii]MCT2583535.1 AMP-binding protein [Actinophytocola gossypii]